MELPAKLLDYFWFSHKSNKNQTTSLRDEAITVGKRLDTIRFYRKRRRKFLLKKTQNNPILLHEGNRQLHSTSTKDQTITFRILDSFYVLDFIFQGRQIIWLYQKRRETIETIIPYFIQGLDYYILTCKWQNYWQRRSKFLFFLPKIE